MRVRQQSRCVAESRTEASKKSFTRSGVPAGPVSVVARFCAVVPKSRCPVSGV